MKKILLIAGPNGAGKTTFVEEFLPLSEPETLQPETFFQDVDSGDLSAAAHKPRPERTEPDPVPPNKNGSNPAIFNV